MAQKDITQKILISFDDVFCDIVNVLLFGGRRVIREDSLQEKNSRAHYKGDHKIREIERDVKKYWIQEQEGTVCIGIENQVKVEKSMPLRVIGYDGAEYRLQLVKQWDKYPYIPVITMVLYYGYKAPWREPAHLIDCLKIPEVVRPYVNDYRAHIYEIAYLEREQVEMFQSDFYVVADYLHQMRETGDYNPSIKTLEHAYETLQLMSALTGDVRYEEAYASNGKGEPKNMCVVVDRFVEKGRQEGRLEAERNMRAVEDRWVEKGRQEGRIEEKGIIMELVDKLLVLERIEDIKKMVKDEEYLDVLLNELKINTFHGGC